MQKLTEIFRPLRTAPRRWLSRLVRFFGASLATKTEHDLQMQLNAAHSKLVWVEREIERYKEYAQQSEKNERIFKEWAAETHARVLRLYPDVLPKLRAEEAKERERHWVAGGY